MKIIGDSKVTEKFQATIPRVVRELLQLESGDRVVFVSEHGHVLVKKGKLEVQV
jgi:AbrB family looped-hinge helix DNA binding protein